jgi:hypothetical protein
VWSKHFTGRVQASADGTLDGCYFLLPIEMQHRDTFAFAAREALHDDQAPPRRAEPESSLPDTTADAISLTLQVDSRQLAWPPEKLPDDWGASAEEQRDCP